MSGGEPSSIKQLSRCAARQPAPSRMYGVRTGVTFDFKVYGLILQLVLFYYSIGGEYMHQALYRKWRPQVFDDVCGQEHITSILKYETENSKFSHAYLFCGSRGTGKTTCAKILAKAVNCESPINGSPCNKCAACLSIDSGAATDVLEMDAASNNGVENIRDIRDEVVYTPTSLKYRVYIVDEVHMLSGSAFNALLKTLEEPPSHVIFILATTELHKLPATIVSRCQRFDFRRISTEALMGRLSFISEKEGIEVESEALRVIAKLAQGGMRDAISLLELCAGNRALITEELVNTTLGAGGQEKVVNTVKAIANSDYDALFDVVDETVRSSKDISVFWNELISIYRDLLVLKTTRAADKYLDLTDSQKEALGALAALFTKEMLLSHIRILDDALYTMQKAGSVKRIVAEMALIKMSDQTLDPSYDNILSRLSKLELFAASGGAVSAVSTQKTESAFEIKTEAPKQEHPKPQATSSASTVITQKSIRGWNEIAERTVGDDGFLLSFLKLAKAYATSDKKLLVTFPNELAMDMVDGANIKGTLCSVVNIETQSAYTQNDVIYRVTTSADKAMETDLDDFE